MTESDSHPVVMPFAMADAKPLRCSPSVSLLEPLGSAANRSDGLFIRDRVTVCPKRPDWLCRRADEEFS